MSKYVCIYVCMYVYMSVCLSVCMSVFMYVWMYVCIYVCMYVSVYVLMLFEIPFLGFKRVFRSQCSEGNCWRGRRGMGGRRNAWNSSGCENHGWRQCEAKVNNEGNMEIADLKR